MRVGFVKGVWIDTSTGKRENRKGESNSLIPGGYKQWESLSFFCSKGVRGGKGEHVWERTDSCGDLWKDRRTTRLCCDLYIFLPLRLVS